MKKIKSNMNYPFLKSGNFSRNLIIVCIITFLQMVNTLYAQCYTSAPCSGGGAFPSYSITSSGTLASGTYKFGNNTLTISGSSTTYTISNSCIEFNFSTSAIIVTGGATLVLDNCILYSSSGSLWQGIKVNSTSASSTIEIKNGTIIGDAVRGIWANNSTYESEFNVTGSTFCHCQYGIYMSPFSSGVLNSYVSGTLFNGGTLLGGGNSLAGIYMNGIGTSVNVFPIGNTAAYGTSTNEFTGMNRGIFAEDSYFSVQDCNFHDLNNLGSNGYGIYSKNTDATEDVLVVGALTGYGFNNHFNNCRIAIFSEDDVKTSVAENLFTSDFNVDVTDGYTMEQAIRIENSTSLVAVSGNDIENYEQHGVWLKNISDDYAAIFENTFDLTSGFGSSAPAMAIRVFETTLTDDLALHIYENIINAGKTGIFVYQITPLLGHGNVIYNNEIYFSLPEDYPLNAYGIQAIGCASISAPFMVMSNYCEGNGTDEDKIRGIYFEDTQGFWCLSNHVNNCSIGIYCNGDVNVGIINCNEIEDCSYEGMFFNNIGGPSSTILYPNMTATGDPSGNFWLPDPGAPRGASNGSTNFLSSTWNFSDNGGTEPEYFMPDPCFPGGSGDLSPTNIGGANECSGIPYMRIIGDEEEEEIFSELINMYSLYADAFNNNYPEGSLNDFYTLSGFWENVATHDYNPEELPDNLKDFYEYIALTNIPDIFELKHAISAHEYEAAAILLETITPANDIEYYIIRTSELFLDNLNEQDVFEINDEILPEIRSIAVLNGWDYGKGVYMARAMMDTTIEFNLPPIAERLTIPIGKNIVINPNPAYDFIHLQYPDGKPVTEIESVEICDLSGAVVIRFSKPTNIIDISAVQGGIYLIRINMPQGHQSIIKLEILN